MTKDELDIKFKKLAIAVLERYAKHHYPSTLEQELVETGYQAALENVKKEMDTNISWAGLVKWIDQALAEVRKG